MPINFTVDRDDWTWAVNPREATIELKRNGQRFALLEPSIEQWAMLGVVADDITGRAYQQSVRRLADGDVS